MLGLTRRQQQVLEFVQEFITSNGYSPSYEEIGIALRLNSVATIQRHVKNLKARGRIDYRPGVSRSIILKQGGTP